MSNMQHRHNAYIICTFTSSIKIAWIQICEVHCMLGNSLLLVNIPNEHFYSGAFDMSGFHDTNYTVSLIVQTI